jgi:hypothetical protein
VGGCGIYLGGLIFALVADDTLYLKADAENAHYFDEQGLASWGQSYLGTERARFTGQVGSGARREQMMRLNTCEPS